MKLNCDIGERGAHHPEDVALMSHIDIANLACGGHAGDEDSVREFTRLANEYGVELTAHLSYPDREHFGRQPLAISTEDLLSSLDVQWQLSGELTAVKFHGALYNESVTCAELAGKLVAWCKHRGVNKLLAPHRSALERKGIQVVRESFVDRRYQVRGGGLELVPRNQPGACIETVEEAMDQFALLNEGQVKTIDGRIHDLLTDTVCIHSDSATALPLARAIQRHE